MLKFDKLKQKSLFAAAVLFFVAYLVLVAADFSSQKLADWSNKPNRDGYYGIFLSNGQAYFGTIGDEDERSLVMHNIFYIQKNPEGQASNDMTLLKLGNELHGPEDMMEVSKSHIVFIEKLKSDGKVMQAIQNFKK